LDEVDERHAEVKQQVDEVRQKELLLQSLQQRQILMEGENQDLKAKLQKIEAHLKETSLKSSQRIKDLERQLTDALQRRMDARDVAEEGLYILQAASSPDEIVKRAAKKQLERNIQLRIKNDALESARQEIEKRADTMAIQLQNALDKLQKAGMHQETDAQHLAEGPGATLSEENHMLKTDLAKTREELQSFKDRCIYKTLYREAYQRGVRDLTGWDITFEANQSDLIVRRGIVPQHDRRLGTFHLSSVFDREQPVPPSRQLRFRMKLPVGETKPLLQLMVEEQDLVARDLVNQHGGQAGTVCVDGVGSTSYARMLAHIVTGSSPAE